MTLIVLLLVLALGGGDASLKDRTLVDFSNAEGPRWQAVNDGVMGGLSQSRLRVSDAGHAVFEGVVSLENNGGFASVRALLGATDLSGYEGLSVRVRGDGRSYRLRLRTDDRFDGIAYQAIFETAADEWHDVRIPFAEFRPTFRGRTPRDAPRLDPSKVVQVGLRIADKRAGEFRHDDEWIKAYLAVP